MWNDATRHFYVLLSGPMQNGVPLTRFEETPGLLLVCGVSSGHDQLRCRTSDQDFNSSPQKGCFFAKGIKYYKSKSLLLFKVTVFLDCDAYLRSNTASHTTHSSSMKIPSLV